MSIVEEKKGWTPRQRAWVAWGAAWLLLSMPPAITGGWSLIAGVDWSWDRYWSFFLPVVPALAAPFFSDTLVRHDLVTLREKERRKRERDREVADALRDRSLPPGADPNVWRGRLQRLRRKLVAIGACLVAVWGAAVIFTALAAHFTSHDASTVWGLAAAAFVFGVPLLGLLRGSLRRIAALLATVGKAP